MREARLAYILIAPAVLFLAIFVAYPFVMALWMSLTSKRLGIPSTLFRLGNYLRLLDDDIFRQTAWNAVLYTVVAVRMKTVARPGPRHGPRETLPRSPVNPGHRAPSVGHSHLPECAGLVVDV